MSKLTDRITYIAQLGQSIRSGGVSATAYGPLLSRWLLHKAGARPDEACDRLLRALPSTSSRLLDIVYDPAALASKMSGIEAYAMAYPVARPSNPLTCINHRTEFLDGAMRDYISRVDQVVILGAGWDTRAYGLLANAEVHVFEVDAPGTQAVKRKALNDATIDASEVVFVAVDFNHEPWLDALVRNGFDVNRPTFFLWEGVIYYLDEAAVGATLDAVATQCAAGSAIAFDYFSSDFVAGRGSLAALATTRAARAAGEPFRYGVSTSEPAREQLVTLLGAHKLTLASYEPLGDQRHPFGGLAVAVKQV